MLHHSVDYLIGLSKDNFKLVKSSHKYGFSNPDDFESAIKYIAKIYKQFCLKEITSDQLLSHFTHLNQQLQQTVLDVITARKDCVFNFLLKEHNSKNAYLLESFNWDLRWVMGSSSLTSHRDQLVTLALTCTKGGKKTTIPIELDKQKLNEFIKVLEDSEKKQNDKSIVSNQNE